MNRLSSLFLEKSAENVHPVNIRQMNLEKEFADIYWRKNALKTYAQDPIELALQNFETK